MWMLLRPVWAILKHYVGPCYRVGHVGPGGSHAELCYVGSKARPRRGPSWAILGACWGHAGVILDSLILNSSAVGDFKLYLRPALSIKPRAKYNSKEPSFGSPASA